MSTNFGQDLEWFTYQVSSRKRLLPTFASAAGMLTERISDDLDKFIELHAYDKVYEENKLSEYAIPPEHASRQRSLTTAYTESLIFADLLPRMTLVSLVSVFDAFIARLLKNLFSEKPEILNGSEKTLSFSQLTGFSSMEDAREYLVNCEIESLLRENHSKQFDWMEKKLGINLRSNLPAWKIFIEITERRNLLVHADGVVNGNYINSCKNNGHVIDPSLSIGDRLHVEPDYYESACDCVAEIGIKLCQVMWRRILPEDIGQADTSIISVSYNLLLSGEYGLAEQILRFAASPPFKCISYENELYLRVNLAISLKSQNRETECLEILNEVDWSALSNLFKMANLVLREQNDEAEELMRHIGQDGRPSKAEYANWPLFKWFRKTDQFKRAYEDVFGEPFKIVAHTDGQQDGDQEIAPNNHINTDNQ